MINPQDIHNIDDPRISEFFNLRDFPLKEENKIIVESPKVIDHFLQQDLKIFKVLARPEFYQDYGEKILAKKVEQEQCFSAPKKLLEKIVGFPSHQGAFILGERPREYSLEELTPPFVILNGLTSPENVGKILRTCHAFGVKSVIFDSKTCSAYLRRVIRVSMGSVFKVQPFFSLNLVEDLQDLKEKGIEILATGLRKESCYLSSIEKSEKIAIILGSEGRGVDPEILDTSDKIVKIKIEDDIDSLNVDSAAAIVLFHLL